MAKTRSGVGRNAVGTVSTGEDSAVVGGSRVSQDNDIMSPTVKRRRVEHSEETEVLTVKSLKEVFASELANINIQIDRRFADLDARVWPRSRSPLVIPESHVNCAVNGGANLDWPIIYELCVIRGGKGDTPPPPSGFRRHQPFASPCPVYPRHSGSLTAPSNSFYTNEQPRITQGTHGTPGE